MQFQVSNEALEGIHIEVDSRYRTWSGGLATKEPERDLVARTGTRSQNGIS